jgi:hypothetical protein
MAINAFLRFNPKAVIFKRSSGGLETFSVFSPKWFYLLANNRGAWRQEAWRVIGLFGNWE